MKLAGVQGDIDKRVWQVELTSSELDDLANGGARRHLDASVAPAVRIVERKQRLWTRATAEHHHLASLWHDIHDGCWIMAQLATRAQQREILWRLVDGSGHRAAKLSDAAFVGHVHRELATTPLEAQWRHPKIFAVLAFSLSRRCS
jgi:hypothetical protein